MKMKEIQAMSDGEIQRTLTALREQVRDLAFKIHSKEIKNYHLIKTAKKDIARIMTLIKKNADGK